MSNKRRVRAPGGLILQVALALLVSACEPPVSEKDRDEDGGSGNDSEDVDADQGPSSASDAGTARDGSAEGGEPENDGGGNPDPSDEEDGGGEADASVGPPPPPEARQALCTDAYDSVALNHPNLIRGSWQFNPGGSFVMLPEAGYPCKAFLHDGDVRPAMSDPQWTDAAHGEFLGFSERSTVPESDYTMAQFRYFRSLVFVPAGARVSTLTVSAFGIDDAVYVELFNSKYPEGVSPVDAGPSDPAVGACQGNDSASWDFKNYIAEGEVNALLVVHADMNPATSTLTEVRIEANGEPIPLVSCKD
jgi:hypothetical protein